MVGKHFAASSPLAPLRLIDFSLHPSHGAVAFASLPPSPIFPRVGVAVAFVFLLPSRPHVVVVKAVVTRSDFDEVGARMDD